MVDGGSEDDTMSVAGVRATTISAPRGRARQMNAGAAIATGDILLFLHADTLLPFDALSVIRSAMCNHENTGGCFRTSFDTGGFWLGLWSWNGWMSWDKLAFGDRAIFVRRDVFREIDGYPSQPLFEDLELVKRLRAHGGSFVFLKESVVTSARRFNENGRFLQQVRNLGLWLGWLIGVPASLLERFYSRPSSRELLHE